MPPHKAGYLAFTFLNEASRGANCHTYNGIPIKDDQIYINFNAQPWIDPRAKVDPEYYLNIVPKPPRYGIGRKSFVDVNGRQYPVYKLEKIVAEEDNTVPLPHIKLSDLQASKGSFYFEMPDPFAYTVYGVGYTSKGIEAGIFFISLTGPLNSMTLYAENQYNQPTEEIPFDIFEFGFNPAEGQKFGFDTSQVTAFSIPIWFDIFPKSNQEIAPLPMGIRTLDTNLSVNPKSLHSQSDIVKYYSTQYEALKIYDSSGIFSLSNLGKPAGSGENSAHIMAPPHKKNLTNDKYFLKSVEDFISKYKRTDANQWPFLMCTDDPGKDSTLTYPLCTTAVCSNITTFPQVCDKAPIPDDPNRCKFKSEPPSPPPSGLRIVGTCYIGYVDASNHFKYFKFLNDTLGSNSCFGTIAYNGSKHGYILPPQNGQLCEVNDLINTITTKCAFNNDCIKPPNETLNPQFMAALMRGIFGNGTTDTLDAEVLADANAPKKGSGTIPITLWKYPTDNQVYYQTPPYNIYSKIFHDINAWHHAYTMGYDDAGNQSTTYTPQSDVSNVVIGIGW